MTHTHAHTNQYGTYYETISYFYIEPVKVSEIKILLTCYKLKYLHDNKLIRK